MNRFRSTRTSIVGLSAAFAAMALLGAGPAHAIDDNNSSVFDTLTSLVGLSSGKAAPVIDYRERAPLVLPPKMELRQPLAPGADRAANWPQDPDVLKRQQEAAGLHRRFGAPEDGTLLSKRELMGGRAVSRTPARHSGAMEDGCMTVGPTGDCLYFSPDKLKAGNPRIKRDEIVVGEDPGRTYLTQPPTGYRRVTAQTGAGPQQQQLSPEEQYSPYSFFRNLNPFRKSADEE